MIPSHLQPGVTRQSAAKAAAPDLSRPWESRT